MTNKILVRNILLGEDIAVVVQSEKFEDDRLFLVSFRNKVNKSIAETWAIKSPFPWSIKSPFKLIDKSTGLMVVDAKNKKELMDKWNDRYKKKYEDFITTESYKKTVEKYSEVLNASRN